MHGPKGGSDNTVQAGEPSYPSPNGSCLGTANAG
jgi:hypothetical protein